MAKTEHKAFAKPDNVLAFEKGKIEELKIGGGAVKRLILEPGWRWTTHIKPLIHIDWCPAPHFWYMVSGTVRVKMADGEEFDLVPGSVSVFPQGHDAWVVGSEPAVAIDWAEVSTQLAK